VRFTITVGRAYGSCKLNGKTRDKGVIHIMIFKLSTS
jgi:hypothetical protein